MSQPEQTNVIVNRAAVVRLLEGLIPAGAPDLISEFFGKARSTNESIQDLRSYLSVFSYFKKLLKINRLSHVVPLQKRKVIRCTRQMEGNYEPILYRSHVCAAVNDHEHVIARSPGF